MYLFDLHCDTPFRCYTEKLSFEDFRLAVSANKGNNFECWRQCFAIWISDEKENPYSFYKSVLRDFNEKLKAKPANLKPYLTLEGGSLIDSTEKLFELKNDGIRAITLTWNGENQIAGGAKSQKGLTDFGKDVIRTMNTLGIFCDLSHLNRKSFYEAIDTSSFPFASHSSCYNIVEHNRNLTDEQIKLISEKGGIIGLTFYPEFTGKDVFEGFYRNVVHILDLGFEDVISIGSDFDGADMSENLDSIDKITSLYRYLEQKSIEKEVLYKIFYGNALKFFDK